MKNETARSVAPYAAWMALMMLLPSTPWAYGVRTVVTLVLLAFAFPQLAARKSENPKTFFWGVAVGLLTLVIWIAPDSLPFYRRFCVIGDPYSSASPLPLDSPLTWIQLFGSAFVISVAEELFFRKWLIRYAGFGWMVALFAIEHDRYVVGAIAGVLYGLLYLKKGLPAAIVAHATTNLLLGLYVLHTGRWEFW